MTIDVLVGVDAFPLLNLHRHMLDAETTSEGTGYAFQYDLPVGRVIADNERALELSQVRFRVGSGDLRAVNQQQVALYSARSAQIHVEAERRVQRVNLYLALGGSFEAIHARTAETTPQ